MLSHSRWCDSVKTFGLQRNEDLHCCGCEETAFNRLQREAGQVLLAESVAPEVIVISSTSAGQHLCSFSFFHRAKPVSDHEQALFSECNSGCSCSRNDWDPICGENGVTYVSACLAGCRASNGTGKNTVRQSFISV